MYYFKFWKPNIEWFLSKNVFFMSMDRNKLVLYNAKLNTSWFMDELEFQYVGQVEISLDIML